MTDNLNQQLIQNISIILKKSLSADATLMDLREHNKTGFAAVFTKDAGFDCSENTFQPYVQELADNLVHWQEHQDKPRLQLIVKQIEQLFTVLANFESSYN